MGNKTMIETAKWLIVGAVVFRCLYIFSLAGFKSTTTLLTYTSVGNLVQSVGWALLCISAKEIRWRVSAAAFMAFSLIFLVMHVMSLYAFIHVDDLELRGSVTKCRELLNYVALFPFVIAFPFISTEGTMRFKKSVHMVLLSLLAYNYIYYDWTMTLLYNSIDNDTYGLGLLWCSILLGFVLSILMSAALYRMITLYEVGEGSSDQPIRLKKVFTSKSFFAILVFILLTIFVLPILSQVN